MKSLTGAIGWFLLAAALVVPAFLFYSWWMGAKTNEAPVQVPVRGASTATVFGGAQDRPAAQPAADAAAPQAAGRLEETASAATFAQRAAGRPVDEVSPAAVPQGTVRSTAAALATGSYFSPKSDRDPTMTPEDYEKMREEAWQRLEDERARQLAARKQQKESGGENRIKLQGIVGDSVIINGEMYSVGRTVAGVKILKIGPNYIIGEYKGKKFRKSL
ncbi:MAG: hypothetical protein WCW52_04325 [Elusimicrobiales bacterium]|jgi:hypothetical protein